MRNAITKQQLKFYLWTGFAYLVLWMPHSVVNYPGHFSALLANNLWRIAYIIVLNFIFFEHSIPYVLQKRAYVIKNILLGIFVLWIHLILWSFGLYIWRLLGIGLTIYTPLASFSSVEEPVTAQMSFSAGSVFFFGIIRHFYRYTKLKQAAQQLRIEKQEAELNYLKSQTNPHFLFNTLNNIYSLARDKSDLAPESILRLSKILRFMLYEASGAYVVIEQEVKIIEDYIALEQLRYDESLRINFQHDVENLRQSLPPLLLMPLVENAFKHGVSETRGHPFIDIHLSVKGQRLQFEVKNSSELFSGNVKENIGLSNLRRQLELLYREYALNVQQTDGVFTARLTINLASHV